MISFKTFNLAPEDAKYIRFTVFCDEQGVEKSHEIDEMDTDTSCVHLVMYKDKKPVATSRYFKEESGAWHVGRIAVLKEYRGFGYGRMVLEKAHEDMKKLGATKITISAQIQAQGFYETLGYKAYGDVYPEENIPHIAMELEL